MRENCTYGSEGGEGREPLSDPYPMMRLPQVKPGVIMA